ncbi:acyltransferase family protein [Novosphingobium sp. B 225]|uniref:acyltransferase family protein n=1 Tax=Novosphingobium sp. B 225 TaxID=1961849 RepID=UPI000B4B60EE|nr:acyltransferase [Novosphingobium sp. B 225]
MTGAAAKPHHLDALTGIRGIAAWAVVFYHIRLSLVDLLPAWTIAALGKGYLAVDLFFILSGFVIWYNYADKLRRGGWAEARLFLWRRFARVWPLHAAVLGGFVGLVTLLLATGRDASGYPLEQLPLHFALVQNWGLTDALSWNHPAWSISTELAAYLLFPLVVMAARWEHWPRWALYALLLAMAGTVHAVFAAHGYTTLGEDISGLGLWRCLPEFAMGMVLCILWQRWTSSGGRAWRAAMACLFWFTMCLAWRLPETALVPGLFFLALAALSLDTGPVSRLLGNKVLTYLGEISYSTYLAHFLLFIVWKLLFVDASLQLGWLGLGGYLGSVAAASVGLYHGLEKPAQRWLNRRPPQWANRSEPLPAR